MAFCFEFRETICNISCIEIFEIFCLIYYKLESTDFTNKQFAMRWNNSVTVSTPTISTLSSVSYFWSYDAGQLRMLIDQFLCKEEPWPHEQENEHVH